MMTIWDILADENIEVLHASEDSTKVVVGLPQYYTCTIQLTQEITKTASERIKLAGYDFIGMCPPNPEKNRNYFIYEYSYTLGICSHKTDDLFVKRGFKLLRKISCI